jgi:ABC-type bacteriocin/lantibiotic exporter with double-glycine peptidase domain
MNNTPHKGPFPLHITKNDDHFVIVTNHETHYAKTFDPSAARLIASAPDLLQVVADYVLLCDLHDYVGAVPDAARAALRKAKGEA